MKERSITLLCLLICSVSQNWQSSRKACSLRPSKRARRDCRPVSGSFEPAQRLPHQCSFFSASNCLAASSPSRVPWPYWKGSVYPAFFISASLKPALSPGESPSPGPSRLNPKPCTGLSPRFGGPVPRLPAGVERIMHVPAPVRIGGVGIRPPRKELRDERARSSNSACEERN